jgi:hypothetical protein
MIKTVECASEFASARDETASAMALLRLQSSGFALAPKRRLLTIDAHEQLLRYVPQ